MRPAFPTTRNSIAFGILLLFLLTLPLTLYSIGLPSRYAVYRGVAQQAGPFDFLRRVVFEQTEPLDVVVLGHSLLKLSMEYEQIEQGLQREFGRPARTLVAGLNWEGVDMQYFLLRDLLEHRKVRMLIVQMPTLAQRSRRPHAQTFRVFRWGDFPGALDGLGVRDEAGLYAACVLGAPRHLLTLLRPNLIDPSMGALRPTEERERFGYFGSPFVAVNTRPPEFTAESLIYSPERVGPFDFSGAPLNSYQLHFARKIAELARQHHTQLVVMHVPLASEYGQSRIVERGNWRELLGQDVEVIGAPSASLFPGMDEDRVHLYYEDEHMNFNGMRYFTRVMTPALVRIYRDRVLPREAAQ